MYFVHLNTKCGCYIDSNRTLHIIRRMVIEPGKNFFAGRIRLRRPDTFSASSPVLISL